MRTRLHAWWDRLRATYWFVPGVMAASSVLLSLLLVRLDRSMRDEVVQSLGWIYTGGPEGARGVLSTIASSMITVAGVTFSMTIATLSLATSQFGPRLLRNFMRDRGNQFVLGTFVSTYLYCLLVLRTVRGTEEVSYVPHLAVTVGVALAIVSVGVLIYFVHHVAESIQVSHLVEVAGRELQASIERVFPVSIGDPAGHPRCDPAGEHTARQTIRADVTGYLQSADADRLLQVAGKAGVTVRLLRRPGDFLIPGVELCQIWPAAAVTAELRGKVVQSLVIGRQRTTQQDVSFALQQLVEVALRALSPSLNDPFTAIMCIDRLTAGLCCLVERPTPSPYRADEDGIVRVIAAPHSQAELGATAFGQIATAAVEQQAVRERLREQLALLLSRTQDDSLVATLRAIDARLADAARPAGRLSRDPSS